MIGRLLCRLGLHNWGRTLQVGGTSFEHYFSGVYRTEWACRRCGRRCRTHP